MKLPLAFALTIAAIAATPINNFVPIKDVLGLSSRIISGSPAQRGQFKYQAIVKYPKVEGYPSFCGGSLISSRWILTAVHCTGPRGVTYTVTLGALYIGGISENGKQTFTTTRVIVHPDYENISKKNDIALIDLQTNVRFSDVIQPIALSTENIGENAVLTVSGWGKTSDSSTSGSPTLNYVTLTSISNNKCKQVWTTNIIDGSLCCDGSQLRSPCHGDSGGPLVKYNANGQAEQVGIASYVYPGSCTTGHPSVFVRVKSYAQWIANTMNS